MHAKSSLARTSQVTSGHPVAVGNPAEPGGAPEALKTLAGRMNPAHLLATECLALAALLSVLLWIPSLDPLAFVFVALASFGVWGLADQARRKSGTRQSRTAFAFFQSLIATVGIASFIVMFFAIGELLIGTVIS